jgi:hypothetical protein
LRQQRRRQPRSHEIGQLSSRRYNRECTIGGGHQPAREADALGLVAVEQGVRRAGRDHRGQFPGKIDGIADPGVHALATNRTMDMRRIAQQKGAALAKMIRDAVVHAIAREPVHLLDFNFQMVDRAVADIGELQRGVVVAVGFPHHADQPHTFLQRERKDRQKIGFIEIDMEFAIDRRPGTIDIGDIESLLVSASRKSRFHGLAHGGMGAVAPGDVERLALLLRTIGALQLGGDMTAGFAEAGQFGLPLDRNAQFAEPLDQQLFMLVLRKDHQERVRRQIAADVGEVEMGLRLAPGPKVDGRHLVAALDHAPVDVKLTIEFERARLHRKGARGRAGLLVPVDNAHPDPEPCQPQRQNQAGRAGARNQHIAAHLHVLRFSNAPASKQLRSVPVEFRLLFIFLFLDRGR